MKTYDEVFLTKQVQVQINSSLRDFVEQYKAGNYYIGECFEAPICTIIPDSVGCHQPSSICEVFDIHLKDLVGEEDASKMIGIEMAMHSMFDEEVIGSIVEKEIIDREGYYGELEEVICEQVTEPMREELDLYGGEIMIGWWDGEVALIYYINPEEVCELIEDEEGLDC